MTGEKMNLIIITTTTSATLGFSLVVVVIIMKKPTITSGDGRWRHIITRGDDMIKTLGMRESKNSKNRKRRMIRQ